MVAACKRPEADRTQIDISSGSTNLSFSPQALCHKKRKINETASKLETKNLICCFKNISVNIFSKI
jgi:hypothetical protein